jgi:hypothetical protein
MEFTGTFRLLDFYMKIISAIRVQSCTSLKELFLYYLPECCNLSEDNQQ